MLYEHHKFVINETAARVLYEAIDWLWENKKILDSPKFLFASPDWAGMPKRLSKMLSSDLAGIISDIYYLGSRHMYNKRSFTMTILTLLPAEELIKYKP